MLESIGQEAWSRVSNGKVHEFRADALATLTWSLVKLDAISEPLLDATTSRYIWILRDSTLREAWLVTGASNGNCKLQLQVLESRATKDSIQAENVGHEVAN